MYKRKMSASLTQLRQRYHIKDSCKIRVAREKTKRHAQTKKALVWISISEHETYIFCMLQPYTLDCIQFFPRARPTSVFSLITTLKTHTVENFFFIFTSINGTKFFMGRPGRNKTCSLEIGKPEIDATFS